MHLTVLHLFKFFAAREDFIALVGRPSKPAPPTFLSPLRAAHPFWLRLCRFAGQPILAAAGFQPAMPAPKTRAPREKAWRPCPRRCAPRPPASDWAGMYSPTRPTAA